MISVPQPGRRLITQNLVGSAESALQVSNPSWISIQDLAALIDAFCMYDSATVLGRGVYHSLSTSVGNILTSSNFITVEELAGKEVQSITDTAKRHLLAFVGSAQDADIDPQKLDNLLKFGLSLNVNQTVSELTFLPDGQEDLESGKMWLKAASNKSAVMENPQWERGAMFVIRSFLYAAYSDVSGLILIPDSARCTILGTIVSGERQLRSKLLEKMAAGSDTLETPKDVNLKRVSPLAAIVFERAKPDKARIPAEMDLLRAELAPVRERLRAAENKIFFGKGAEVADATIEWNLVIDELGRHFGNEPHLISLDGILRFGRDLGDVVDSSAKPKAWIAALLGLPFDILRRIIARGPAIELHELQHDLPGAGRLKQSILQLFGSNIRM